ncbi:hypothetical protein [Saccharopolyspora taberi]|uniref:Uncharacterized protein n=1 Tax=Saccharopolyspora taberi TaxID=60895 RepID=A0ABN3V8L1_9PSEU
MSASVLTSSDVVGFIQERADEHDLTTVIEAVKARRQMLRDQAAAAVKPGLEVVIDDISPKYLQGLRGVVKSIDSGRKRRAVVTLDRESTTTLGLASSKFGFLVGRDSYDLDGIPVTCCKVTGA